ncbi:MAG TPA: sigma-70 family RNA polymerase sigma factor [Candidatus Solibacter sp.]|jgi:RNA polymerase sigma-70 factor (ECF subfamily)
MEQAGAIGMMAMDKEAPVLTDFDSVVQVYRPRIFRFALASLRDRDEAESVTQDCFLRAFQGRQGFRGDCSVQTWLMQIAVNLVRDAARNRRLRFWKRAQASAVDLQEASEWLPGRDMTPEERASARQQVAAVWSAMTGLSEKQRTVFLLHFLEEMSPAEIEAASGPRRRRAISATARSAPAKLPVRSTRLRCLANRRGCGVRM